MGAAIWYCLDIIICNFWPCEIIFDNAGGGAVVDASGDADVDADVDADGDAGGCDVGGDAGDTGGCVDVFCSVILYHIVVPMPNNSKMQSLQVLQATGCYFFLPFNALKVKRRYIFQLL